MFRFSLIPFAARLLMACLLAVLTSLAQAQNLVTNGNFSQGNTGFITGYTYIASDTGAGDYFVGSNPHAFNPGGASFGDHTTGTGLMMIVNAATAPNTTVWQQSIPVSPNTAYIFSVWAASWTNFSPAVLRFAINGQQVGLDSQLPTTNGLWKQFSATWNSGANTSATLKIIDINTAPDANDFSLDDFSFSLQFAASVSGVISLNNCNDPEQNITFEFRPKPSGTPFKVKQVLKKSGPNSGTFSLPGIPYGTYDLAIKSHAFLQRLLPNIVVSSDVSGLSATLMSSDLNDDNQVDIADFGILVSDFGLIGDD